MLKQNLRRVMGKTEPIEKFGKLKQWKIHVSSFLSVDGISLSAIMKKLKNGCHFINIDHIKKISNYWPSQSLGLRFSECQRKWNNTVSHYEKVENGCHFINIDHMEKFQIINEMAAIFNFFIMANPPKVWVSSFLSVDGNRISLLAIMKKLKNGCHFININIYVWLHLKHLWVDIYAWFTSHLCVVLHFLIFKKLKPNEWNEQISRWKVLIWISTVFPLTRCKVNV